MKGNLAPGVGDEAENGELAVPTNQENTDRTSDAYKMELGDGLSITVREIQPSITPKVDTYQNGSESSLDSFEGIDSSLDGEDRATWGGKMEFLLTCIGYAVGLGNVWRFPYLCYKNGGGAFLVPYTLMLALVGLPLFYMELGLGQFASLGPITVWRVNPLFKGLGYAMVLVSWMIGLYYNVVIAHVLFYLYSSFTDTLPWTSCDHFWNTPNCLPFNFQEAETNSNVTNATITNYTLPNNGTTRTPSEEYYRNYVLGQSSSIDDFGGIQWQLALTLFISWTIVCLVLLKGISSLGKVVYFTAIFPYLMLTVLLIRGVTLPGASQGIIYYLKPDFSRLLDPRVWSDAATQIFYSLSACSGGLIAMASYNKFTNNCYRDAMIVCIINCCTSVFAGLVIFSVLGFMASEKGVGVAHVADDGPGLAFIVYPEALARMPVSPLWAVFFFIMMATLGFGSEFSIVECVFSAVSDEFPILKSKRNNIIFRIVGCFLFFLLGLPMVCNGGIWLLNLVDYSVGGFPLLVVGLMELLAVSWIYGFDKFSDNLCTMHGIKPNIYWKATWKYVSPLVVSVTIVLNIAMFKEPDLDDVLYPAWAVSLGWLIACTPIVAIVGWAVYLYCKEGGFKLLKDIMKPLPTWGPANKSQANYKYANVNVKLSEDGRNPRGGFDPACTNLLGSTISNVTEATTIGTSALTINTDCSSTNLIDFKRTRDNSESKV